MQMNADRHIDHEIEEGPKGDLARDCEDSTGPSIAPAAIAPPPPSAPSEFLASQWLWPFPSSRSSRVRRISGDALTPPPPSAPGEFLSAQWWHGVVPEMGPSGDDTSIFQAALPDVVAGPDQLDRLADAAPGATDPASVQAAERSGFGVAGSPARIRGVPLGRDEVVALAFLPDEGLVDEIPSSGQALILTNHRLIAFRGAEGFRDTHMALASEIAQFSVRTGQRNWGATLQGLMIMVGGAFLYLVVGYWLAGQVSGPNVPVLNIDLAPLIALLIILAGLFVFASNYLTRPAGALIFRGEGVEITFPFRSSLQVQQVYDFVDRAHLNRRRGRTGSTGGDPIK